MLHYQNKFVVLKKNTSPLTKFFESVKNCDFLKTFEISETTETKNLCGRGKSSSQSTTDLYGKPSSNMNIRNN